MGKTGRALVDLKLVIAENLKKFMRTAHDEELKTSRGLGARACVGRRTVDRLINPASYPEYVPGFASLAAIAAVLEKDVWEFLIPPRQALIQDSAEQKVTHPDKRHRRLR